MEKHLCASVRLRPSLATTLTFESEPYMTSSCSHEHCSVEVVETASAVHFASCVTEGLSYSQMLFLLF